MPAPSLAQFIPLAREGTRLGLRPLDQLAGQPSPDADPELAERLKRQQLDHFEQSVAYAKAKLHLGGTHPPLLA
jgi:hypothetical protein